MRELTEHEQRIANAVAKRLLELQEKGVRAPTRVAVHRTQFRGVGELLGLKLVRVGYIREDEAALLLMADDMMRPPLVWR